MFVVYFTILVLREGTFLPKSHEHGNGRLKLVQPPAAETTYASLRKVSISQKTKDATYIELHVYLKPIPNLLPRFSPVTESRR
jgi:hypothetical protein